MLHDENDQDRKKSCNNDDSNFVLWLLKRFSVCKDGMVPVSKISQMYEETAGKENKPTDNEVGRMTKQVFPSITLHKVRIEGKRCYAYKGIEIRSESREQLMTWNHLKDFDPGHEFRQGVCSDQFVEWHKMLPDKWNGQRIVIEVKIYNSLAVQIRVARFLADLTTIGIDQDSAEKTQDFFNMIFYALSIAKLCKGFLVNSHKESFNVKGQVQGKYGEWSSTTNEHLTEMRHKAIDCNGIISLGSKSELCKKCWQIKKCCGKKLKETEGKETTINPDTLPNRKRKSLMSKEELMHEFKEEKRKRINTQRREAYLREKIQREMIEFIREDHDDFVSLFQDVPDDGVPEEMKLLWKEQAKALSTASVTGRRWHPKVIRLCLSIWNRSPQAYAELKNSDMLVLPSGRLLEYYKSAVPQKPGLSEEMLKWMRNEANRIGIDEFGRCGGIVLDEMSLQGDLQMKSENGQMKLVGLVSLGEENEAMSTMYNSSQGKGLLRLSFIEQ